MKTIQTSSLLLKTTTFAIAMTVLGASTFELHAQSQVRSTQIIQGRLTEAQLVSMFSKPLSDSEIASMSSTEYVKDAAGRAYRVQSFSGSPVGLNINTQYLVSQGVYFDSSSQKLRFMDSGSPNQFDRYVDGLPYEGKLETYYVLSDDVIRRMKDEGFEFGLDAQGRIISITAGGNASQAVRDRMIQASIDAYQNQPGAGSTSGMNWGSRGFPNDNSRFPGNSGAGGQVLSNQPTSNQLEAALAFLRGGQGGNFGTGGGNQPGGTFGWNNGPGTGNQSGPSHWSFNGPGGNGANGNGQGGNFGAGGSSGGQAYLDAALNRLRGGQAGAGTGNGNGNGGPSGQFNGSVNGNNSSNGPSGQFNGSVNGNGTMGNQSGPGGQSSGTFGSNGGPQIAYGPNNSFALNSGNPQSAGYLASIAQSIEPSIVNSSFPLEFKMQMLDMVYSSLGYDVVRKDAIKNLDDIEKATGHVSMDINGVRYSMTEVQDGHYDLSHENWVITRQMKMANGATQYRLVSDAEHLLFVETAKARLEAAKAKKDEDGIEDWEKLLSNLKYRDSLTPNKDYYQDVRDESLDSGLSFRAPAGGQYSFSWNGNGYVGSTGASAPAGQVTRPGTQTGVASISPAPTAPGTTISPTAPVALKKDYTLIATGIDPATGKKQYLLTTFDYNPNNGARQNEQEPTTVLEDDVTTDANGKLILKNPATSGSPLGSAPSAPAVASPAGPRVSINPAAPTNPVANAKELFTKATFTSYDAQNQVVRVETLGVDGVITRAELEAFAKDKNAGLTKDNRTPTN